MTKKQKAAAEAIVSGFMEYVDRTGKLNETYIHPAT